MHYFRSDEYHVNLRGLGFAGFCGFWFVVKWKRPVGTGSNFNDSTELLQPEITEWFTTPSLMLLMTIK